MTPGAVTLEMPRSFDGRLVKTLRESKGMSIELLAGLAGCTSQNIKNIEAGTQEPKVNLLGRLADALGVKTDAFYRLTK